MPRAANCPASIAAVHNYPFHQSERLFFDANVWVFVYGGDHPPAKQAGIYEQAFRKINDAGCAIYTDVLVVSEFVNVRAHMAWRSIKKHRHFKQFRQSKAFIGVGSKIVEDARKILSHCQLVDTGLDIAMLHSCLADYQAGKWDFNDSAIAQICHANNLTLLTDDADFAHQKFPAIITGNQTLLKRK